MCLLTFLLSLTQLTRYMVATVRTTPSTKLKTSTCETEIFINPRKYWDDCEQPMLPGECLLVVVVEVLNVI